MPDGNLSPPTFSFNALTKSLGKSGVNEGIGRKHHIGMFKINSVYIFH